MNVVIAEIRRWKLWFPTAIVIIAVVALWYTFLTIKFQETIVAMEENPIGRWLIQIAGNEVGIFVRFKLAGTILVLCALFWMHRIRSRILFPVSTSVASYQLGLLAYLTVA